MVIRKCNQPNCKFNEDGKCLEGLGDACTHQFDEEVNSVEDKTEAKASEKNITNGIKLFSGEYLSLDEITMISHKFPYRLITILGNPDSGKTTLLATLYDLFQKGPFNEFMFSGSLTQIGFERSCHFSRIHSGNEIPDTERTVSSAFQYGHLALKKKDALNKKAINLLISNISGERYMEALESSQSMKEISFIKKSDFLIIMIDGGKIANLKERSGELFNTSTFIQKAIEEGVFDKQTDLKIILSKWDLLHKDSTFNFSEIIEEPLTRKYLNRVNSIAFSKIASRPLAQDENIKFGHGVHNLLVEWCEPKQDKVYHIDTTVKSARSFSNYKFNKEKL